MIRWSYTIYFKFYLANKVFDANYSKVTDMLLLKYNMAQKKSRNHNFGFQGN